jgi:hyaluronate lyase
MTTTTIYAGKWGLRDIGRSYNKWKIRTYPLALAIPAWVLLAGWCLIGAITASPVARAASADMATFRANLLDFYCGKGADLDDPSVAAALARMEQTAKGYLESMTVDGLDPGLTEPPTVEELQRRRTAEQTPPSKTPGAAKSSPNAKPNAGGKDSGKKSGGEIGSWRDLASSIQGMPNSSMWSIGLRAHYDRVLLLAQAYRTPGGPLHRQPAVKQAVERGLAYAAKYVYASMGRAGMTDPRQVRVPMRLGPILILMQGELDAQLFQHQVQMLGTIMSDFDRAAKVSTGANLVWDMMNQQFHALLTADEEKMDRAARLIGSSCAIGKRDGIQTDGSYLFHDGIVTIGSYGTGQVHELARYALFAKGTAYAMTGEQLATVVDFAADGMLWSMYHNYPAASAIGRAVTRGQKQTGGFHALLYLANTPNRRQAEFAAAAKKMLETWQDDDDAYRGQISAVNGSTAFEIAGLISAVKRSPVAAAWPAGHRHYPRADYTVHRGANYFLSLKMLSKRVRSGERAWGDGMKTWHLSDGFTYLVLGGQEYFERDVLPTLDWQRLPGTTVERREADPQFGFGFGTRTFVGGVSLGGNGVSAMDFAAVDSPLTAKKSWFFFGDEIVCLGSDIHCPTANHAETIVNQWPLSRDDQPLLVNGQAQPAQSDWSAELANVSWAACDGIGYYFPGGQTLRAQRAVHSGRWEEIGSRPGDGIHENTFLTLWYDHSVQAAEGQYAYALLPNRTPEAVGQYAASKPFTVLADSRTLHAVKHHTQNAVGAVFWQAGAVDAIAADQPCIVYYRMAGKELTLAVSDPAQGDASGETKLRLTFSAKLRPLDLPPGISSAVRGHRTEIDLILHDGVTAVGGFSVAAP